LEISPNILSTRGVFCFYARAMNPKFRTLLVLGRVSNLPTVWSNCLAGWWLGGGGIYWNLPYLLLGVTALYTGGMFLNDAFDADSDRLRRPERPIPSGKISADLVWRHGFSLLGCGILLLMFCGKVAAVAAVLLALTILLYNFTHKFFMASPWLMGACRFWVYIIAGAAGADGLNGFVIFCGTALAFYMAGVGYVARRENVRRKIPQAPLLLTLAPVAMAMMLNAGEFRRDAIWISVVLLLWLVRCVRNVFIGGDTNALRISANLLAGIVIVDFLAVAPQIPHLTSLMTFLTLFVVTKWFQKAAPAA
jgi:4-hydroxybenzoate polyprenyltransferase